MSNLLDGFVVGSRTSTTKKAASKATGSKEVYDFKYRDGSFSLSNELWDKLALDENSINPLYNDATNQVALQVVTSNDGVLFHRTSKTVGKKSRKFIAPAIADTLEKAGILTKTVRVKGGDSYSQFFNLEDKGEGLYLITAKSPTAIAESTPGVTSASPVASPVETAIPEQPVAAAQIPSSDELLNVDLSALSQASAPEPEQSKSSSIEDEDFDEKF